MNFDGLKGIESWQWMTNYQQKKKKTVELIYIEWSWGPPFIRAITDESFIKLTSLRPNVFLRDLIVLSKDS